MKLNRLAKRATLAVLAVLMSGVLSIGLSPQASAALCTDNGRACRHGYFYNNYYSGSGIDLFGPPDGVGLYTYNVVDFEGTIGGSMLCTAPLGPGSVLGVPQSNQNATAAAFIVLTMLGAAPGTPKNVACERYLEWVGIIRSYDAAGLVEYDRVHNFQDVNTMFDPDDRDVVYFQESGASESIVFLHPTTGAVLYAIKQSCGNPLGRLQRVPPLPPPVPPGPPPYGDLNPAS